MKRTLFIPCLVSVISLAGCIAEDSSSNTRPNVVLIIADDMGYSDIGSMGSEIVTPNLDSLANDGVLLTNFHASASCTVSRAMLLTGIDNHKVGFGANPGVAKRVPELQGNPGYTGEFVPGTKTLAHRLRAEDYETMMSGKWHLGHSAKSYPPAQGYDRSFYVDKGGASHFSDSTGLFESENKVKYLEDSKLVNVFEDFYSSTFYTEKLIDYLSNRNTDKSFFAHLAYAAPHWPLQVPNDWLDKYAGKYDQGWEKVRSERINKMVKLGLVSDDISTEPLPSALGLWSELSADERKFEARRMEIYAAMISLMDKEIGRLVTYLKQTGEYDKTLIVFLSDNGPEGNNVSLIRNSAQWIEENFDQSYENMGKQNSYVWLGRGWGHVSAGPLSKYKTFLNEGGIRVPAIIKLPKATISSKAMPARYSGLVSVLDILPTVLDVTGDQIEEDPELQGRSILNRLVNSEDATDDTSFALEIYGGRAIFNGPYKGVLNWPPIGDGSWAVYDIQNDPGETNDLAAANPDLAKQLGKRWDQWADANNVYRLTKDIGYGRYPDQKQESERQSHH